jgi:hypothetical protein
VTVFLVSQNWTAYETWTPVFDKSGKYAVAVKYEIMSITDNDMNQFSLNLLL